MNTMKTALLLGALTGLLMLIGGYFGGQRGVIIAFIFAMVCSGVPSIKLPKGVFSFMRSSGVNAYAVVID